MSSFLLTDHLHDNSFKFKGKTFNCDMAFDNVLNFFALLNDKSLSDDEKIFIAIEILVIESADLEIDSYEEQYALFKYLLKHFIDIDLDEKKEKGDNDMNDEGQPSVKSFDYQKDAELIFASFYRAYRIDLFKEQGKLHWKKFTALLINLDDDTAFKKVIGYRMMKIPTTKEASNEYISHIRQMKNKYSLDERPAEERINDTLTSFAKNLK